MSRRGPDIINHRTTRAHLWKNLASFSFSPFLGFKCLFYRFFFFFKFPCGSFWKIATRWLCLYSWLPSILYLQSFQSRFFQHSLLAPIETPPPFPGRLVDAALVRLFPTLAYRGYGSGGWGRGMYSGNTSKKRQKKEKERQQFSAWISLWLNPLIIPGFPERERAMERHVLFSNNSYLHPFLPLHCCVVVGHTCPPFLGELPGLKLFYASAPRAPIWKV